MSLRGPWATIIYVNMLDYQELLSLKGEGPTGLDGSQNFLWR